MIPFLDGDRQVVPNKHPALIYKHPPVLLWSNRFTIIIYFFDGEPLITIQLFVRPSFRSSCRLLRSGGLKEEERVINIYLDQLMNRGNTRLYIYVPRRILSRGHHYCCYLFVLRPSGLPLGTL